MSEGFPRLLGDIGGTHARWAWQARRGAALEDVTVVADTAAESLYASAAAYLERSGHAHPQWAGIGIATAVTGDDVRMTNHPWSFSITELKHLLGLERCLVINDFTALAMSLPALGPAELRAAGGGAAVADAAIGLLGPGTGLGVSGLMPAGPGRWSPLSGEGGHATLAATNEREAALLTWLRSRLGHVSAERVLSGSGLVNLVDSLPEAERYTYVFDGNAQSLDHLLVSPALAAQANPALDIVHINAEFNPQVSDHDPAVGALALVPACLVDDLDLEVPIRDGAPRRDRQQPSNRAGRD